MNDAPTTQPTAIHPFEAAGLGKAPFRFVGLQTDDDRAAVQTERAGAGLTYTTNYCTSCDYCSQAIHNAFQVRSSDGKQFKVGCDCIRKVGDVRLISAVKAAESAKRRAVSATKRRTKVQHENALIDAFRAGRCDSLRLQPHPKGREGATAWDYVDWCIENHYVGAAVIALLAAAEMTTP